MLELHESILTSLSKEDFQNLVTMNENVMIICRDGFIQVRNSKELAIELRQVLQDFDDRTSYETTGKVEPGVEETEKDRTAIENPNPLHRQKGFKQWLDLVTDQAHDTRGRKSVETKKTEILNSYTTEEVEAAVVVLT
jgi:hypothetical protein